MKLFLFCLAFGSVFLWMGRVSAAVVTEASFSPSQPDGGDGWYRSPVNVTLTATDLEAGIGSINWRIDSSGWESQSFPPTLNLAPNSSFENGTGSDVVGWQFSGTNGATAGQDLTTAKYGSASVKITAVTNGWSAWSNVANYSVAVPLANMTASVWLKTSNVSGAGASFKIYALSPAGSVLLAASPALVGTNNWIFVSQPFSVAPADAYGIYLELGLSGTGTVWYDGVSLISSPGPTQTFFTFSQNGNHTLEYYAINQLGAEETPPNIQSLKIDTVSPYNWREFDLTQAGNDHTLKAGIKVDDPASGIDGLGGLFQYSVDGGVSWGYHSNLTSCNSGWVSDGWLSLTTGLENNGNTAELATPAVDYCNSNWSVCKIIRFKVRDLADNESQKDICINGAWSSVSGGDVYSGMGISMGAAGAEDNADGLILTPSSVVSNFSSSRHWLISGYGQMLTAPDYERLYSKHSNAATITVLPKVNGYFQTRADFTIGRNTIPSGLSTAGFGAVVFVNGDLIINENYSLSPLGAIIFVVAGDILIDKGVTDLAGFFLADERFDTAYNGGENANALIVRGGVSAGNITLSRSLRNNDNPAEIIAFEPKYYVLLGGAFSANQIEWKEVRP